MAKNRLDTILQLAEAKENDAAQEFAEARKAYEFNQEKLNELRTFRQEYELENQNRAMQAGTFQSTRKFLSQLCEVIDQQEQEVSKTLGVMNREKESWMHERVKRLSVEKLANNRANQLLVDQQKREQKEMDEMASLTLDRIGS